MTEFENNLREADCILFDDLGYGHAATCLTLPDGTPTQYGFAHEYSKVEGDVAGWGSANGGQLWEHESGSHRLAVLR